MSEENENIFEKYEEEVARLKGENKKISRQLVIAQNMIDRMRASSRLTASLSAVIAEEKLNNDIFFNLMLKNSPDIILILDDGGRFLYCTDSFLNKTHIENFGLISGRTFSRVFRHFLNVSEIEHFSSVMAKSMLEKESITLDMAVDFSGKGSPRNFSINFTPMDNSSGSTIGAMVLFHDVTDFLQAQQSEAASKAKSSFLATMSHEIRTPLNAIIGLSEIELQNDLPPSARRNLESIYSSGSNLLGIVNDVLDISKIESGNFELVPHRFDVPSLINDVVQLNIVRIGAKALTFDLVIDETIPSFLFGDDLRIKRILNNLLSNAFKYTERGKVTLRAEWRREGDSALMTFAVSDTGRGIKAQDMGRLFREYSQLDSGASRHIEGTGLGLSITKKLTALMGGAVSVESEYGVGSTFTATIRLQVDDAAPIGKDIADDLMRFHYMEERREASKYLVRSYMPYGKVLVVDDVATNLDVARGLMLPYGLMVDCADSGAEAIEKICVEGVRYDVVFMDHMMPDMDGVEATALIRRNVVSDYALTVPIVALTANALTGNKEMFLANGFNDFLSKPIDVMKLDAVLNRWVRDVQSEETLLLAEEAKNRLKADAEGVPRALGNLSVKGVDLPGGVERYSDAAIYMGVLRSFVRHTPSQLKNLRRYQEDSLPKYAVTVHGIKGAAYGICAAEAGSRAEALERAAKAGDIGAVRINTDAFIELIETLISDLSDMLKQLENPEDASPKKRLPRPDEALLTSLLRAAARFRTSRMEEIMSSLELYEYETGGELVQWLSEQMENLEYEAIRKRLEGIVLNTN